MAVRRVLRARADGADRMLVMNVGDDPEAGSPVFTAGVNCVLGRTVYDAEEDVTAAELLFHRKLAIGETYLAEYEISGVNPKVRTTELTLGFRQPTRECVLQVVFHPKAVPARCYPVWQPQAKQPAGRRNRREEAEQRIEPNGSVHVALVDIPAGLYGLRWEWEQGQLPHTVKGTTLPLKAQEGNRRRNAYGWASPLLLPPGCSPGSAPTSWGCIASTAISRRRLPLMAPMAAHGHG